MLADLENVEKSGSVDPLYNLAVSLRANRPVLAKFFADLVSGQTDDPTLKQKIKTEFSDLNLNLKPVSDDELLLRETPLDKVSILRRLSPDRLPSKLVATIKLTEPNWFPLNPSCVRTPEGTTTICRVVNYFNHGMYYTIFHPQQKIISRNLLIKYDDGWREISREEVVDLTQKTTYPKPFGGFEDCRLFQSGDQLKFTATTWETHPEMMAAISLGELDGPRVSNLLVTPRPKTKNEKNWLPFIYQGQESALYWYSPLTIIRLSDGATILERTFNCDLSRFRGGAGPIPFEGGWLCLVHDKVQSDPSFIFFNRFLWFNADFSQLQVSKTFYCHKLGIEFVSGMCPARDGTSDTIILGVGVDDREAIFLEVDSSVVSGLINSDYRYTVC